MFARSHFVVDRRAASLAALLLVSLAPAGCADEVASQEPVAPAAVNDTTALAVIDGRSVTLADIEEFVGKELALLDHQYGSQRYQMIEAGIEQVVRKHLLEAEAESRGIEVEALVAAEIDARIEVTEPQVEEFYAANQSRLQGRPLEMLRPAIRQFLVDQRREELLSELTTELAEAREIERLVEPYRAPLETEGHPGLGPAGAEVTLVEFSDFECPYCGGFVNTLEQIKSAYAGKLRLVYRQLPLNQIHPNAQKAAEASLCAFEQDRFWELHDTMFGDQQALTVADLKAKAGQIGLDQPAFDSCLDSGKYADRVASDVADAERLGIDGTPALFVNGRPLPSGAVPFEAIAELIDDELERISR